MSLTSISVNPLNPGTASECLPLTVLGCHRGHYIKFCLLVADPMAGDDALTPLQENHEL